MRQINTLLLILLVTLLVERCSAILMNDKGNRIRLLKRADDEKGKGIGSNSNRPINSYQGSPKSAEENLRAYQTVLQNRGKSAKLAIHLRTDSVEHAHTLYPVPQYHSGRKAGTIVHEFYSNPTPSEGQSTVRGALDHSRRLVHMDAIVGGSYRSGDKISNTVLRNRIKFLTPKEGYDTVKLVEKNKQSLKGKGHQIQFYSSKRIASNPFSSHHEPEIQIHPGKTQGHHISTFYSSPSPPSSPIKSSSPSDSEKGRRNSATRNLIGELDRQPHPHSSSSRGGQKRKSPDPNDAKHNSKKGRLNL